MKDYNVQYYYCDDEVITIKNYTEHSFKLIEAKLNSGYWNKYPQHLIPSQKKVTCCWGKYVFKGVSGKIKYEFIDKFDGKLHFPQYIDINFGSPYIGQPVCNVYCYLQYGDQQYPLGKYDLLYSVNFPISGVFKAIIILAPPGTTDMDNLPDLPEHNE
ncbi:hypothetical protein ID858_04025 [Xenorhabdus sp. DI]|uniref:hypothetical protein n=1 Tax=Xenorhabdus doucetiae TaxID=351671 RepID=UPI0019C3C0CC|nr:MULTISPECIES: hypothetical protein [unclassified Xenorhabdus]MBD2783522.1 hypothetical protein [Xenorhabdus sp. 3]MBD2787672.1 hypothetical protein [Xenorhabdus sp. DI]